MAAACAHLAVMPEHFREWWAYGAFFLTAAAGQGTYALLVLVRPRPWLVLAGIAGNLAIVGMYVLSRTNGVPLGPHAGQPEPATALDISCTAAEVGVIAASLALLPRRLARPTGTALMVAGSALWGARLSGLLL
jgi:hypothetical protein